MIPGSHMSAVSAVSSASRWWSYRTCMSRSSTSSPVPICSSATLDLPPPLMKLGFHSQSSPTASAASTAGPHSAPSCSPVSTRCTRPSGSARGRYCVRSTSRASTTGNSASSAHLALISAARSSSSISSSSLMSSTLSRRSSTSSTYATATSHCPRDAMRLIPSFLYMNWASGNSSYRLNCFTALYASLYCPAPVAARASVTRRSRRMCLAKSMARVSCLKARVTTRSSVAMSSIWNWRMRDTAGEYWSASSSEAAYALTSPASLASRSSAYRPNTCANLTTTRGSGGGRRGGSRRSRPRSMPPPAPSLTERGAAAARAAPRRNRLAAARASASAT
mmetsp:Transcript_56693/g.179173  ORF Transcript_56693/g.179173 Transcript_56693/m.179173 type:complete len:336 (-) Transcript_56693:389-1396(-)